MGTLPHRAPYAIEVFFAKRSRVRLRPSLLEVHLGLSWQVLQDEALAW
jgi:hypothetical protein